MINAKSASDIASLLRDVAAILESASKAFDVVATDSDVIALAKLHPVTRKFLLRHNLTSVGEVCSKTCDDLMAMKGIGPAGITEIRNYLELRGRRLKDDA